jgi:hypothetical protein
VRKTGIINSSDTVLPMIQITLPEGKQYLMLDELTILNIIAANKWKRPIYFTSDGGASRLGIAPYLRKSGLAVQFVPVISSSRPEATWVTEQMTRSGTVGPTNVESMYNALLNKFGSGNANVKGVYFDEENRRHLLSIRSAFAETAGILSDQGRKPEGIKLLDKSESLISPDNLPYAMAGRYNIPNRTALIHLEAAFKAGHTKLADKIRTALRRDLVDQKEYFDYMKNEESKYFNGTMTQEAQMNEGLLQILDELEKYYGVAPQAQKELPPVTPDSTRRN